MVVFVVFIVGVFININLVESVDYGFVGGVGVGILGVDVIDGDFGESSFGN